MLKAAITHHLYGSLSGSVCGLCVWRKCLRHPATGVTPNRSCRLGFFFVLGQQPWQRRSMVTVVKPQEVSLGPPREWPSRLNKLIRHPTGPLSLHPVAWHSGRTWHYFKWLWLELRLDACSIYVHQIKTHVHTHTNTHTHRYTVHTCNIQYI